uniref:Protein-serine/threonine phosphatase n=1 Tax=Pygocentrus nattereri TaxID=42514 RepID=A0AAR2LU96_PYGNA
MASHKPRFGVKTEAPEEEEEEEEHETPSNYELEKLLTHGSVAYTRVNEVWPNVFIGDEETARNRYKLERMGVTHVLNAAEGQRNSVCTGASYYTDLSVEYFGIEAEDIPSFNLSQHFFPVAEYMQQVLSNPHSKNLTPNGHTQPTLTLLNTRSAHTHSTEHTLSPHSLYRTHAQPTLTLPNTRSAHTHSTEHTLSPHSLYRTHAQPTLTLPNTRSAHTHSTEHTLSPHSLYRTHAQPTLTLLNTRSAHTHSTKHTLSPHSLYRTHAQPTLTLLNTHSAHTHSTEHTLTLPNTRSAHTHSTEHTLALLNTHSLY